MGQRQTPAADRPPRGLSGRGGPSHGGPPHLGLRLTQNRQNDQQQSGYKDALSAVGWHVLYAEVTQGPGNGGHLRL